MQTRFLKRALRQAKSRRGFCAPNPAVGAVVVHQGKILAEGRHLQSGSPHAEVDALAKIPEGIPPEILRESTLYVTLEPCCHFGRTPPCTDLVLRRGIGRVIFGFLDPNPVVAGNGMKRLREAGVDCAHVPIPEIDAFYRSYSHWTRTRLPWVTAKLAMSLDGKIAEKPNRPVKLTGASMRRFTHWKRLQSDAILTTARTVVADNPRLNARLGRVEVGKPIHIVDRAGRTTGAERVFQNAGSVTLWKSKTVDLPALVRNLGELGYHDVWVEAGGEFLESLLKAGLVHTLYLAVAPKWVGSSGLDAFQKTPESLEAATVRWRRIGRDALAELEW